jgi:ribulose-phosphate 3-epimerase
MIMNPSLACGNWLCLKEDIDTLRAVGAEMFHIDVMDGHYVPNLCFPIDVVRAVRAYCDTSLEVHLMVDDPAAYIEPMQKAGADMLSFHLNATRFPISLLRRIRGLGMQAGIALNPTTAHSEVEAVLPYADFVNVMGVEPGFPGQSMLLLQTVKHLSFLNKMRAENQYGYRLMVDGGVDTENAAACIAAGADILVAGALAIYGQADSLANCAKRFMRLEKPK